MESEHVAPEQESIAATAAPHERSDGGSEPSQVSQSLDQLLRAVERSSITTRHEQSRIRRASAPIQARLSVGSADDPHEREADEVAARVVESARTARTQRAVGTTAAESADAADRVDDSNASARIHRSGTGDEFRVDERFESEVAASTGSALHGSLRRKMEPAIGADFSQVRIHEGPTARRLSAQIGADAFTTANNVFIGRREFDPDSEAGTELLAHELTHVVQQGAAPVGDGVARRRTTTIRRVMSSVSTKAFTTAKNANPANAEKEARVDKYPNTDEDNVTLAEQEQINDLRQTVRTRRRITERRTGGASEEEQLLLLADVIRARNLAAFSDRTVRLHEAPIGEDGRYKNQRAKNKKRQTYIKKAVEQSHKDRGLLRRGVAASETLTYLAYHGFESALDVSTRQKVTERLRGPRIDVRSTFIGGEVLGIRQRAHLFIVYTGRDGEQMFFRGGPSNDGRFTVAAMGRYEAGEVDYDPSAPSVTVMEGPDAEAKLDALVEATSRVNEMRVPYEAQIAPKSLENARSTAGSLLAKVLATDGENCNRAAWTILDRAGVPTSKPNGKHPGWGKPLGATVEGELKKMGGVDDDDYQQPIEHTLSEADTDHGERSVQSYLDRALFAPGAHLAFGDEILILGEGLTYRKVSSAGRVLFIAKSDTESVQYGVYQVRDLLQTRWPEDHLRAVARNDRLRRNLCREIGEELGVDSDLVGRALDVHISPAAQYLEERLDALSDAQLKEMLVNIPRLVAFAKEVHAPSGSVARAIRARVEQITARERLPATIRAYAPTPLELNRLVNDLPGLRGITQIAAETGVGADEVRRVADGLRPPENQGNLLTATLLTKLARGVLRTTDYAEPLGVGEAFLESLLRAYTPTRDIPLAGLGRGVRKRSVPPPPVHVDAEWDEMGEGLDFTEEDAPVVVARPPVHVDAEWDELGEELDLTEDDAPDVDADVRRREIFDRALVLFGGPFRGSEPLHVWKEMLGGEHAINNDDITLMLEVDRAARSSALANAMNVDVDEWRGWWDE